MVVMSDEVLKMFDNPDCDKQKVLTWVSTVTKEGDPHLAPVCFVKIGVSHIKNRIKCQEWIACGCWKSVYPNGYMIKGSGEVMDSGNKEHVNKRFGGKIKPKAVLLVNVEEVYHLKPAEGKKRII